jgi:hypothetical protein
MAWKFTSMIPVCLIALCAVVFAQSSDGPPVIQPHRSSAQRTQQKAAPSPAPASILVVACDLACTWSLDGKPQERIEAGGMASVRAFPGDHIVTATSSDGLDHVRKIVTLENSRQSVLQIELQTLRDTRLKAQQEQLDAEARRRQQEQDRQQELARQQERARQQEANRQPGSRSLHYQAVNLVLQGRYAQAIPLYQRACDEGEMESCRNLGVIYEQGQGVPRSKWRALELYRKACQGGNTASCSLAHSLE